MRATTAQELCLIIVPFDEPVKVINDLRDAYSHYKVVFRRTLPRKERDLDAKPDAELLALYNQAVILVTLTDFPEPSWFPNLKLVQLASAGANLLLGKPLYTDCTVPIATATGIHGPQIAEWVIMTSLVHSHRYRELYEFQRRHMWGDDDTRDDHLRIKDKVQQRLGVLGYGSIGRQVANVARAMGMDVIAFTASPRESKDSKRDTGFIVPGTGDRHGDVPSKWFSGLDKPSLHKFLSQDIDLLLVAVPLTDDTRHLLGAEEFKCLGQNGKRPAFISNIARGAVLDQSALVTALQDGTLSGAALDVTDPEPLPSDSPLWDMKNCIITPHVSGSGLEYVDRVVQLLRAQMDRLESGDALYNVVDRKRGY